MHDGPFRRGGLPPPLRLRFGQTYCPTHSEISLQSPIFYVDTAPDNRTGLTYPAQCTSAKAEIHGRLPPAASTGVATLKMGCGYRTRDEEHPYEVVDAVTGIVFAPPDIVEGVFLTHTQVFPKPIGDQCIDASTFVYLIEMRDGLPGKKLHSRFSIYRRSFRIVEQPFHQVAGHR